MSDKSDRDLLERIEILRAKIRELEDTKNVLVADGSIKRLQIEALEEKIGYQKELLAEASTQIKALREELDKFKTLPSHYGNVWRIHDDGTIDVYAPNGRQIKVVVSSDVDVKKLKFGQRVILNSDSNVIEIDKDQHWEETGIEAKVLALLSNKLIRVSTRLDEVADVYLAESLSGEKIREGDTLLISGAFAYKKLPKSKEVEHLFLAEVPTVTYTDVGGLDKEIKLIRELIEWPYLYAEEFKEHGLKAPKGILLYGPPGCGKTLIAKAIANALGQKASGRSYFMNIKGPEPLNKYVGETERFIREVFARAKELATEDVPVIVFFDEIDALFPVRGSQRSSDTAGTIVPQFTTEMDGVEGFKNIIVIGATNRHDRIDPAVVRPGRFDHKIEIGRPDKNKAYQVFKIYLTPTTILHPQYFDLANYEGDNYIPKSKDGKPRGAKYALARDPEKVREYLINRALDRIFDPEKELNQLMEITFRSGMSQILYATDFVSGAIIEAIINKAKIIAFGHYINSDRKKEEKGLKLGNLMEALEEEFISQERLPSVANPDEWANIFGIREQVINVKSFSEDRKRRAEEKSKERKIETQSPGHYL